MSDLSLQSKPKAKKKRNTHNNSGFFESLREIGDSVASSVKSDLLSGTAKTAADQLRGASKGEAPEQPKKDFNFAEWIKAKEAEAEAKAQEQVEKQRVRAPEKVIFSLADEKLKKEINEVRQELQSLIAAMDSVESQIEKAIVEEVVNPGVYHLNFFEKLKTWLSIMRRNLQDTSLWLDMWTSRSQRSYYHQQRNKSGTKYTLSQERQLATQSG